MIYFSITIIFNCALFASISSLSPSESATALPLIQTLTGQIRGKVINRGSFSTKQFLGIPYALPPLGTRRFQKPLPLPHERSKKIDATSFAPTCIQHPHLDEVISPLLDVDKDHKISEDCLYLNIYIPLSNDTTPLPVMVWFTGEGFDFADSRQFDGSYLASMGSTIVITVQYRVGVFGFLQDDNIAPGNMGLWDQLEALKWIHDNIEYFGGNKGKITVFGRFSGSMSIIYLLTSSILRYDTRYTSLFKKAILISGVPIGDWTLERNYIERSNDFISQLGCDNHNKSECLMKMNSSLLLSKSFFGWKPTLDGILIEEEPLKLLSKGFLAKDIEQIMIGSTKSEGSLCSLHWYATNSPYYTKLSTNNLTENDLFEMIKHDLHHYPMGLTSDQLYTIFSETLRSSLLSPTERYINFCSSYLIHSPITTLALLLSNVINVDTFMYQLNYKPSISQHPSWITSGAHGDDVILAFGLLNRSPFIGTNNDVTVSKTLVNVFSSFAAGKDMSEICPIDKENVIAKSELATSTSTEPWYSCAQINLHNLYSTFTDARNTISFSS